MIAHSPFTSPLRFSVKATVQTALWVLLPSVFVALTVLVFTPWPWYELCGVILLIVSVAMYVLQLHYWQSKASSVLALNQDDQQQWALQTAQGWQLAELLPSSFVSSWLMVLNFQGEQGRLTVILPADSLDSDSFRRLRVRIRLAFS